ncbi:MAG TPA: hypothetical protein ENJ65_05230 [Candidatus Tenderia electrophaga]|uniref:DUF3619 domain-containing protein n=1 Tax=Candidatus Tenderia electrophaga TaxID=1748243 RepID=A0A832N3R4_9GAMM|nr:hypothetical protein [Candidatus Tenderia electrophaga]
MSEEQDKFIKQVRQQLDQQNEALDSETLSRLRQARAHAVETGDRKSGLKGFAGGAVAFASISVLAVAVWLAVPTSTTQDVPVLAEVQATAFDDLELLAATEALAFFEDIEFYYWLETQDAQG